MAAAGKFRQELIENARKIATPGKGILAADESTGTIGKRFAPINVENTEENRRAYRQLLFTTPDLEKYISGVILYDETLRQKADDGTPFAEVLKAKGIIPGIKTDKGVKPLPASIEETYTQGFDDLDKRCDEYYTLGARFAKWRAVIKISEEKQFPSDHAIAENARGLAVYAAISQAHGLVPIVEPEILIDGPHSIEVATRTAERVISKVYRCLHEHGVLLEGSLLKPSMVSSGKAHEPFSTPAEVAAASLAAFGRVVPAAVPGINFLSGGLSEEEASVFLNAINAVEAMRPWYVSFSYGRALQASCLKAWLGKKENVKAAQDVLIVRSKANSEATLGKYTGGAGGAGAAASLYVKDYKY